MGLPSKRSRSFSLNFKYPWLARYKYKAKSSLQRLPFAQSIIRKIWRFCKILLFLSKRRIIAFSRAMKGTYVKGIDSNKLYWVSPQKIIYTPNREFPHNYYKGFIIGGDWDVSTTKFDELDVFVAFKQVLKRGKKWSDTVFYQRVLDVMHKGYVLWGCRNQEEFDCRCQGLEDLFYEIKRHGYKAQHDLLPTEGIFNRLKIEDEISVSIGHDGDLLFGDGAHRLTIAKLLELEQIPIRFSVRHVEWVSFRKALQKHAGQFADGKLPQPVTHPDLDDIPASYESEMIFTLIKKNISMTNGRLLNIGANLGYFCSKFEDEGFECYAIETIPEMKRLLEKLKKVDNKQMRIMGWDVFDNANKPDNKPLEITGWELVDHKNKLEYPFDLVILNIHDQRQLSSASSEHLKQCLSSLQVKDLFLYMSAPNNEFTIKVDRPLTFEQLLHILSTSANLPRIEQLEEHTLYRLSRY